MKNQVFKGSVLVGLGAISYGMLAAIVKLAYRQGFNTAEVTVSQYGLGVVVLFLLTLVRKKAPVQLSKIESRKSIIRLTLAGISLGLTSISYYKAVQYIPASVAIVLLMQTVWMSVLLEMILQKKAPGVRRVIAVIIILAGTLFATNLIKQSVHINWIGLGWGLLAALCYTATMYSSNNIELQVPSLKRSLYMILGGLIIIACIFHASLQQDFSYRIFFSWGLLLSLLGTVLPPILFTTGMPLTGIGLGAIIAAIEIPVTVIMANLLVNEPINGLQWLGVALILFAVVLMNKK